ncbi:hypothetical protein CAPTEDRAFT_204934 [Capitella teleta]|uniref:RING-type domain-containing protein n=1 Tax=Capitella teleta TaxID=283909 RepID=R7THG9_CAPTE|nr:hypothetical protein CAPTEDRAFT_204934 [Capitella teleta]|eukprot:ELT92887.1 hypothetical protein CAPTEDRAFT_204934 [Capitella teleta]
MILCLIAVSCCLLAVEATVDLKNLSLLEIPQNISSDTKQLILVSNNISIVRNDALGYLPFLARLELGRNRISAIEDHAFRGTNLKMLQVQYNKLKWFPNLADVKHTIRLVYIEGNQLKFLRAEQIEGLDALEKLVLNRNKIYSLPDFSVLPALKWVEMYKIDMQCCNKILSLKSDLRLNASILGINPKPCTYPQDLVRLNWWNITKTQIDTPCPEKWFFFWPRPFLPKPVKREITPEEFQCPICRKMLKEAAIIRCCGYSFCDECIRDALHCLTSRRRNSTTECYTMRRPPRFRAPHLAV